jgi:hypothetical protein
MALEENLTALLRAICPRTFSDFAPLDTPRPYVTFQQIGGSTVDFIDKVVPSKENAVMQINAWADSRLDAKALIKQIEAALIAATEFQAAPVAAASSDFDPDMDRRCSRQDFSIWADR